MNFRSYRLCKLVSLSVFYFGQAHGLPQLSLAVAAKVLTSFEEQVDCDTDHRVVSDPLIRSSLAAPIDLLPEHVQIIDLILAEPCLFTLQLQIERY